MAGKLEGRVAVVTGSTAGIGRACAELFVEHGASVIVNDDGADPRMAEETLQRMRPAGGRVRYVQGDVSQRDVPGGLVEAAVAEWGRVDVLMNNALAGASSSALEQDLGQWERMFASQVTAALLGSRAAIPHMARNGGGAILSTSSVHGLLASRNNAAYTASKAALIQLTRQMAVDYGRQGIRVNALCPGLILTERAQARLREHPERSRMQEAVYPLGRPGALEEVARAALFLVSDDASFVTGHALAVDGGMTVQLQDSLAAWVEEYLHGDG